MESIVAPVIFFFLPSFFSFEIPPTWECTKNPSQKSWDCPIRSHFQSRIQLLMQEEDLHDRSLPPRNFDWQFFHSLKKSKNECGIFVSLKACLRTIYLPFRYPLFCEVVRPQLETWLYTLHNTGPAPRGAFRGRAPQITACAPPPNENCAPKNVTESVRLECSSRP